MAARSSNTRCARNTRKSEEKSKCRAGIVGGYGPYFGSVPDFRDDIKGVLFADVRADSLPKRLKAGDTWWSLPPTIRTSTTHVRWETRNRRCGACCAASSQSLKVNVTLEVRK
jgi:hypothetical protein